MGRVRLLVAGRVMPYLVDLEPRCTRGGRRHLANAETLTLRRAIRTSGRRLAAAMVGLIVVVTAAPAGAAQSPAAPGPPAPEHNAARQPVRTTRFNSSFLGLVEFTPQPPRRI